MVPKAWPQICIGARFGEKMAGDGQANRFRLNSGEAL
jgi:hypothetical protein